MALGVLRGVAAIGALLHLGFAYLEIVKWGPWFVGFAAKSWIDPKENPDVALAHITWARPLAFNIGFYNAALTIGLGWVVLSSDPISVSMGIFMGLWLLIAAAAAGRTKVYGAFYMQGALGILILFIALLAWP